METRKNVDIYELGNEGNERPVVAYVNTKICTKKNQHAPSEPNITELKSKELAAYHSDFEKPGTAWTSNEAAQHTLSYDYRDKSNWLHLTFLS